MPIEILLWLYYFSLLLLMLLFSFFFANDCTNEIVMLSHMRLHIRKLVTVFRYEGERETMHHFNFIEIEFVWLYKNQPFAIGNCHATTAFVFSVCLFVGFSVSCHTLYWKIIIILTPRMNAKKLKGISIIYTSIGTFN